MGREGHPPQTGLVDIKQEQVHKQPSLSLGCSLEVGARAEALLQGWAVIFCTWHHLCTPSRACWQSKPCRPLLMWWGQWGWTCNRMPIDFKDWPSLHASSSI